MPTDIDVSAPVEPTRTTSGRQPEEGMALCLSGGGYRAMVFHIGVIWRLYDAGLLESIKRISSVSGGSITAGVLALAWPKLSFDPARSGADFVTHVVGPLRRMAETTIDSGSVIAGALLPGTISDKVTNHYQTSSDANSRLQFFSVWS